MAQNNYLTYDPDNQTLFCQGEWDVKHLTQLKADIESIKLPETGEIIVDGKSIKKMDSAGAWLFCKEIEIKNRAVKFTHFPEKYQQLIVLIKSKIETETQPPAQEKINILAELGQKTTLMQKDFLKYLAFVGQLTFEALRVVYAAARFRWGPLSRTIYDTGYTALPIIALLSFMIGIVITYQMGIQLKSYGANVYIVDLLGISILREFSPLLTAIMVAGRTGSAYTAQIGIMKINQEIDALDTMGVTPAELLILPRIGGLFIALPLLTMWSNIFGVLGGMFMSANMLSLTWSDFLQRFQHVVTLKPLLIGLGKAPVFALIIASIGCYQGIMVRGSAESIGRNTTRSVVLAIFFIIVTDAIFSVIFSKLQL